MDTPPKTIISYIPEFLDFCKKKHLSENTLKNYKIYLKKFTDWLEINKKLFFSPVDLTVTDIYDFSTFLATYKISVSGENLAKNSQNYYLIALRSLLSYFAIKRIKSVLPSEIPLQKDFRKQKTLNYLNHYQLKELFSIPDVNSKIGLRNRAILEVLIATGFKVSQITQLNKNSISDLNIGENSLYWIKKYLETRNDNEIPLFINYGGRRNCNKRLTNRSIEKTISSYGRQIGLMFPLTPEILRWTNTQLILEEESDFSDIKILTKHKTEFSEYYKYEANKLTLFADDKENKSLSWYLVERNINKENKWLKENIDVMPAGYKPDTPFLNCNDCLLRKIAIMIVTDRVKAFDITLKQAFLENGLLIKENNLKRHGSYWHSPIMRIVRSYFEKQRYKVVVEPNLSYGRADLGLSHDGKKPFAFIEIGTVSLFKIWYNLSQMKNLVLIIIPTNNKLLEFRN